MSLEARAVSKRFGAHVALDEVSIRIERGELVALLGPSGGGKTTLLRVLAGLEAPDRGSVLIDERDVTRSGPHARGVGLVFQHYALFREMSVFENVAFGLRVRPSATRPAEGVIRARVHELLSLVQLEGLAGRRPDELSGGQRQRVALARALAVEPRVLLLDEPFGALDAKVRRDLRRWLRALHDDLHVTTVIVTHDQDEAFEIADRVAIIHRGRLEQDGSPNELIESPRTELVASFVGDPGSFTGRAKENGELELEPDARAALAQRAGERFVVRSIVGMPLSSTVARDRRPER